MSGHRLDMLLLYEYSYHYTTYIDIWHILSEEVEAQIWQIYYAVYLNQTTRRLRWGPYTPGDADHAILRDPSPDIGLLP